MTGSVLSKAIMPGLACAHPHVFVDNRVTFLFDGSRLTGFRENWLFDEVFSDQLLQDFDTNHDGQFSKAESDCKPNCSDSTVNSIKSMALVSDILTGVAVAGVGVGAILFFTAKPSAETSGAAPTIHAGVGPGGGKVEATWRF